MFHYHVDGELHGIIVCHIDDFMHAGTTKFERCVIEEVTKRYTAGRKEEGEFSYIGFHMKQESKSILLDQNRYVEDIQVELVPSQRSGQKLDTLTSKEASAYRSIMGKLNWVVQGTRPDLAFEAISLSTKFERLSLI